MATQTALPAAGDRLFQTNWRRARFKRWRQGLRSRGARPTRQCPPERPLRIIDPAPGSAASIANSAQATTLIVQLAARAGLPASAGRAARFIQAPGRGNELTRPRPGALPRLGGWPDPMRSCRCTGSAHPASWLIAHWPTIATRDLPQLRAANKLRRQRQGQEP